MSDLEEASLIVGSQGALDALDVVTFASETGDFVR